MKKQLPILLFILILSCLGEGQAQSLSTTPLPSLLSRLSQPVDEPERSILLEQVHQALVLIPVAKTTETSGSEAVNQVAHILAHKGDSLYYLREYGQAKPYLDQAVALLGLSSDTVGVVHTTALLGLTNFHLGEYEGAIQAYERALRLQINLQRYQKVASLYYNIALASKRLWQYKAAEHAYQRAIETCQQYGCKAGKLAQYLNGLADLYLAQSRYAQADTILVQIRELPDSQADSLIQIKNFHLSGNSKFHQGAMAEAYEWYVKALRYSEAMREPYHEGISLHNLGLVFRNVGDYRQADFYFEEALNIRRNLNDPQGVAATLSSIGALYIQQGTCEKARGFFMEAKKIAEQANEKEELVYIYQNMGEICSKLDELDKAEQFLHKAIALAEETKQVLRMYEAQYLLGQVYMQKGQDKAAQRVWLQAYHWADSTYQPYLLAQIAEALAEVFAKQGDFEQAYSFRSQQMTYVDSLGVEDARKKIVKQYFGLKLRQLEKIENQKQATQSARYQAEIKKVRNQKYIFIGASIISTFLALLIYLNFRTKQHANQLLEEKNELISKQNKEIETLNETLGKKVADRTAELEKRNAQLREYAFMNSHRVRGPLANILGVFRLWEEKGFESDEEKQEFFEMAAQSAKEMDQIIQLMNQKLNEENSDLSDKDSH